MLEIYVKKYYLIFDKLHKANGNNNFNTKKIIEEIENTQTNIDLKNKALYVSWSNNHMDIFNALLNCKNIDLNNTTISYKNLTNLHYACQKQRFDVVESLITHGADINYLNDDGSSPIFFSLDNIDIFKLLIENGADINVCDKYGSLLYFLCRNDTNIDFIKILFDHNINVSDLSIFKACKFGCMGIIKLFMTYNKDIINIIDYNNFDWTLLHMACNYNYINIVKFLVDEGINFHTEDINGKKPIDIAKEKEYTEIVNYLEEMNNHIYFSHVLK
jgi:ankyrin repeat protein